MAELAARDARTVTSVNLAHITALSTKDPVPNTAQAVRDMLQVSEVSERELWWLGRRKEWERDKEEGGFPLHQLLFLQLLHQNVL